MTCDKVNIFYLLCSGEYTIENFIQAFQRPLYQQYNLIMLDGEVSLWSDTETYSKNDIVYTFQLGQYKMYLSLIDNNHEPLNNNEAWQETENIYVDKNDLEVAKSLLIDIIPANLGDIFVCQGDEAGTKKLKYIIGLFMACYIANKNGGALEAGVGGGIANYKSIDGLTASYTIPDYALREDNLFYINNPFGLELLSLTNKLLVGKIADTRDNYYIIPEWKQKF